MNNILQPSDYSKMYEKESRYNEPRYNEPISQFLGTLLNRGFTATSFSCLSMHVPLLFPV